MSKSSFCIETDVANLQSTFGIQNLVFGTFTTKTKIFDPVEAQRVWNIINCNLVSKVFVAGVGVIEPRESDGSIHYHFVLALPQSFCQLGQVKHLYDLIKLAKKYYANGNKVMSDKQYGKVYKLAPRLSALWRLFRQFEKDHDTQLGRCEFMPLGNGLATGRYLSKYLTKVQSDIRQNRDWKGVRLTRRIGCWGFVRTQVPKYSTSDFGDDIRVGDKSGNVKDASKHKFFYDLDWKDYTVKKGVRKVKFVRVTRNWKKKTGYIAYSSVYGWRNCSCRLSFVICKTWRKTLTLADQYFKDNFGHNLTVYHLKVHIGDKSPWRSWGYALTKFFEANAPLVPYKDPATSQARDLCEFLTYAIGGFGAGFDSILLRHY